MTGKPALSFKGHYEVSGLKVFARQYLIFSEGLLVDTKHQKSSGEGDTLEEILQTWAWEK